MQVPWTDDPIQLDVFGDKYYKPPHVFGFSAVWGFTCQNGTTLKYFIKTDPIHSDTPPTGAEKEKALNALLNKYTQKVKQQQKGQLCRCKHCTS